MSQLELDKFVEEELEKRKSCRNIILSHEEFGQMCDEIKRLREIQCSYDELRLHKMLFQTLARFDQPDAVKRMMDKIVTFGLRC